MKTLEEIVRGPFEAAQRKEGKHPDYTDNRINQMPNISFLAHLSEALETWRKQYEKD